MNCIRVDGDNPKQMKRKLNRYKGNVFASRMNLYIYIFFLSRAYSKSCDHGVLRGIHLEFRSVLSLRFLMVCQYTDDRIKFLCVFMYVYIFVRTLDWNL